MRTLATLVTLVLGGVTVAHAAPPGRLVSVPISHAEAAAAPTGAGTLYLNRCTGGCTITKGGLNDARSHISTIPDGTATTYAISEFAWGDTEWDALVLCMKEVYSPFQINVTDVLPVGGEPYNEAIIAGSDGELGLRGVGGIAPVFGDCSPYNYTINFTFANDYGPGNRVFDLCAVAAQESGHSYGLDHTYAFADGSSGCKDPMTYRGDCGGQKFFRNDTATCGEYSARPCRCGANQNSHLKLLSVLGPGTPITSPPTLSVMMPEPGATITSGTPIIATAGAQRGIKQVELWLNGYLWKTIAGAKWGVNGQPETAYSSPLPPEVPDGVIDIVVKAKDDIDVTTVAPTITVTKGAPCTSADTCLEGQRCEDGRCFWDAPVGEIGDPCTYPQYCLSEVCAGTASESRCTQSCVLGVGDSCPSGFTCLDNGDVNKGVCWPQGAEDEGICSAGNGTSSKTAFVLFGLALLLITRRRR